MELRYHTVDPEPYHFILEQEEIETIEAAVIEEAVMSERLGNAETGAFARRAVDGEIDIEGKIRTARPERLLEILEAFWERTDSQVLEIAHSEAIPAFQNREAFVRRRLGSIASRMALEMREKLILDDTGAQDRLVRDFIRELDDFNGAE